MINEEPTEEQLADACMWYRHDFGLLDDKDKRAVMYTMREHWLAIWKTLSNAQGSERLAALEELSAQAQELNMGY